MAKEPGVETRGARARIGIVAPHATPVPMDGGSIRARAIADAFASAGHEVFFFGREEALRITREEGAVSQSRISRGGGKLVPALLTLARRSHYVKEKHMPDRWVAATAAALEQLQPEIVLLNFVWSHEVAARLGYKPRIFLDTHNNEVEWFENLLAGEKSAMGRMVCRNSIQYALEAIGRMNAGIGLIHVSERDREFYAAKRPDMAHTILPNGCTMKPRPGGLDYDSGVKRLFFLGSLSTSMNQEALTLFSEKFWPALKDRAAFTVIGSNPPPAIGTLCRANGWNLVANPADAALDRELESMHYAVMPFPNGAGSKLKLLDACGRGIPVLTTAGGATGFSNLPPGVIVSDVPAEWRQAAAQNDFSQMERESLLNFASLYSWQSLVDRFISEANL